MKTLRRLLPAALFFLLCAGALCGAPEEGVISSLKDRRAGQARPDDPDGDGLLTENEVIAYGSNPNLFDTDGDGLCDGEEILGYRLKKGASSQKVFTKPLYWDSDGDGLPDGSDPHPAQPEMRLSFEAWSDWWERKAELLGLPITRIASKTEDYDADELNNLKEYERGSSPLFKPGKKLAFFAPGKLVLSPDSATTTTVNAVFFSHSSVTGMLCLSTLDLKDSRVFMKRLHGCEMCEGLFMPFDMHGTVFLSRYAVPLDLTVILPKADEKMPAVTYLRIRDCDGYWKDKLPIENPLKNKAPRAPELLMPEDNEEFKEGETIRLVWQAEKGLKYRVIVYGSIEGRLAVCDEKVLEDNWYVFKPDFPGLYVWQAACEDKEGRVSCSESRLFKHLPPEGLLDTDADGASDNEEYAASSDPFDPNSLPLTIKTPENLPDARVREHYYFNFMAMGGAPPLEYLMLTPGNPPGFLLKEDGLLLGLPEREGVYQFTVGVRDQNKTTRRKIFSVRVLPERKKEKRPK